MEEKEIWKEIKGYEGLYQVSNFGNVRSLNYNHTGEIKLLKSSKLKNGYLLVSLNKEGKRKSYKVHRLVAEAFISNPNSYPEVNHIKEFEKDNNRVDNLEWCTHEYNNNHGTKSKRAALNRDYSSIAQKVSKIVYQYDINMNLIKEWHSTLECEEGGFNQTSVSRCCNGKLKTYKGFIWKFALV